MTDTVISPGERVPIDREFTVEARTQTQMVIRRFLAHRLAMASLVVFILLVGSAFIFPLFWDWTYQDRDRSSLSHAPSIDHPFGTDSAGHDLLAQVLRGTQISFIVSMLAVLIDVALGVAVGSIAGYYRGKVDAALMRLTDLVLTIPAIALLAVLAEGSSGSALGIAVVIGLLASAMTARVVRGVYLSLREQEFVDAARALGASDRRIIFRHLLPNSLGTIIVRATIAIAVAILLEAALSFIGFGIRPPDTSLGQLISSGVDASQTRPWLFYFPGLVIILLVLTVNFIGDGLRDAFDPKQQRVRS